MSQAEETGGTRRGFLQVRCTIGLALTPRDCREAGSKAFRSTPKLAAGLSATLDSVASGGREPLAGNIRREQAKASRTIYGTSELHRAL